MKVFPQDIVSTGRVALLACVDVGLVFYLFPLETTPDTAKMMFGGKLTFVSILLAAGTFQYRYFYEEHALKLFQELSPWLSTFNAISQSIDKVAETVSRDAEALKAVRPINPQLLHEIRTVRKRLKEAENYRRQVAPELQHAQRHFSIALSMLCGVSSSLLLSLFADFLYFTVSRQAVLLAFSFGGFAVALLLFASLIAYYAIAVKRHLDLTQKHVRSFTDTSLFAPERERQNLSAASDNPARKDEHS